MRWGWCHVSVDLNRLASDSPLKKLQPMAIKNAIQDLFDPTLVEKMRGGVNAVYRGRTAESGAAESGQAEPKQSWEVRRCCQETNLPQVHEWTEALHSVAVAVTRVLRFPPNLLLREERCSCKKSETCNVDLLRVFFYDAKGDAMGSSPHTDWGSWTVVWQDDVGGLQTYCHAHERWVDVATSPPEAFCLRFVVHVGDVTSLAMGHASNSSKRSTNPPSSVVGWPSPRHRVLSPTKSTPRASLVYFAYPPPGVSLQEMEEALASCMDTESPTLVPYEEYFVLQNQSTEGAQPISPKEAYKLIRPRPLDSVFAEKWQQVQRS